MSVERFDRDTPCHMIKDPQGEYVRSQDYDALQREVDAVRKALRALFDVQTASLSPGDFNIQFREAMALARASLNRVSESK